ncbi:MAG: hypothetical protein P1S46_01990 [bacterium]|nr:hypothetical protein [bacterium]
MDKEFLNVFRRALAARPLEVPGELEGDLRPEDELERSGLLEAYNSLAEAMAVRNKIDGFLGSAEKFEEISALLLTVITAGHMFGYNRAFLLLRDEGDGSLRGHSGIGTLSPEETWQEWELIHREEMALERILSRAMEEFETQKRRLSPLLEMLVFPSDLADPVGEALMGTGCRILPPGPGTGPTWLGDLLKAKEVGVIPMWGAGGRFGAILVDNFASGASLSLDGLALLDSFARPFISALEKALALDRYRERVAELQEANARIEVQHEMLVRLERKNIMGRYSAVLAHNLLNPLVSMAGHLERLEKVANDTGEISGNIAALREAMGELEGFLDDFVSQVEEQFPDRHFWDLNHLINEVIRAYRSFHPLVPLSITLEEGDISLVQLNYGKVSGAIARLMGVMVLMAGSLDGLVVATTAAAHGVRVTFTFSGRLFEPDRQGGPEGLGELKKIAEYLDQEQITLSWSDGFLALDINL